MTSTRKSLAILQSIRLSFAQCTLSDKLIDASCCSFLEDTEDDEIDSEEIVEMFLTYLPGFEEVLSF